MKNQEDLMQRLAVSKKIMDKHNEFKRSDVRNTTQVTEEYQPVNATYNLPQELMSETVSQKSYHDPTQPLERERIMNSKLPDEIKMLMIEQPIVQPSSLSGGAVLSDDLIEGATRLMKKDKISDLSKEIKENVKIQETPQNYGTKSNFNISELKTMIRDVVRDTVRDVVREELKEAGMIVESTQNTNETIQFKVGNHLFIGKVTKVKKIEQ